MKFHTEIRCFSNVTLSLLLYVWICRENDKSSLYYTQKTSAQKGHAVGVVFHRTIDNVALPSERERT